MVPSLSLFTGIGGLALGLGGVSEPVLYCDNDAAVVAVLKKRIQSKDLPDAPIVSDVRALRPQAFPRVVGKCIVEGGFPCQGLSLAGRKRGLRDDRSGLFFELVRVADDFRAKYIFLENVAHIVHNAGALDAVAHELIARGYSRFAWVCFNARDMGAPCSRDRWFCLAVRDGQDLPAPDRDSTRARARYLGRRWARGEPAKRMVPDLEASRMKMLGNAAIPAQVCVAWYVLSRVLETADSVAAAATEGYSHRNVVHMGSDQSLVRGRAVADFLAEIASKRDLDLWLDPVTYVAARSARKTCQTPKKIARSSPPVREAVRRTHWPSPRTFNPSGCRPSVRTVQDLGTAVAMERGTPDDQRAGWVSARWTEWLMGFGPDWTKV